jgi:broad specificity polyphosphatase/5'/3'-nucleotidase SurE
MRPTKVIANIAKLIILPNDVICQVTLDNDTFFSQLDCVKNILNRMTITSFDDGTLFNINIPNNKQKITKLKVYEYIV